MQKAINQFGEKGRIIFVFTKNHARIGSNPEESAAGYSELIQEHRQFGETGFIRKPSQSAHALNHIVRRSITLVGQIGINPLRIAVHREEVDFTAALLDMLKKLRNETVTARGGGTANANGLGYLSDTRFKTVIKFAVCRNFICISVGIVLIVAFGRNPIPGIRFIPAVEKPFLDDRKCIAFNEVTGISFAKKSPLVPISWSGAVISLVFIAQAGTVALVGRHAGGHKIKAKQQFEPLRDHVIKPTVALGKIEAEFAIGIPRDNIFKHGVETDILGNVVGRNPVENDPSPAVFYRVRGMEVYMIPEIYRFPHAYGCVYLNFHR